MSNQYLNLSDLVAAGLAFGGKKLMGGSMDSMNEYAGRALFYSIASRMIAARTSMANNEIVGAEPVLSGLEALAYEVFYKKKPLNMDSVKVGAEFVAVEYLSDMATEMLGGDKSLV